MIRPDIAQTDMDFFFQSPCVRMAPMDWNVASCATAITPADVILSVAIAVVWQDGRVSNSLQE